MSILIKGFPLPNNCGACPLRLAWCRERIYMVTRPERCPLVPVPPHGDLIDRDALEKEAQKRMLICNKNDNQFQKPYEIMRAIETAPTIIPAKEGET